MDTNNSHQTTNLSEVSIQTQTIPDNVHNQRKILLMILGVSILLLIVGGVSYYLGTQKSKITNQASNIQRSLPSSQDAGVVNPTEFEAKATEANSMGMPQSGSLDGISRQQDISLSPSAPGKLRAEWQGSRLHFQWLGTGDDRIKYYNVYNRINIEHEWHFFSQVPSSGDNRQWYYHYLLDDELNGAAQLGISAVDNYGNESQITIIDIASY